MQCTGAAGDLSCSPMVHCMHPTFFSPSLRSFFNQDIYGTRGV